MPSPATTLGMIDERVQLRFASDLSKRFEVIEVFDHPPAIEADYDWDPATTPTQAEFRAAMLANKKYKAFGTNMTSALATLAAAGGVTLTTAGANNDQAAIRGITVNSGATNHSAVATTEWDTTKSPRLDCDVLFSSVANVRFYAGFKLTFDSTPTMTEDADQATFYFDTGASTDPTFWHCVTSVSNTDTDTSSSGVVAAVAASTVYRLSIRVDSDRRPAFYVNDVLVTVGPVLGSLTTLKPFIGIHALTGAAKAFTIRHARVSRLY